MGDVCIPMLGISVPAVTVKGVITRSFQQFDFDPTPQQMESVYNSLLGKDVFISVPTGSGKSLCYGLLPTVYNRLKALFKVKNKGTTSIVIIISPLLSLMQDQVTKFNSMKIAAAYLGHTTNEEVRSGKYELLFTSPENCLKHQELFLSDIYQEQLCCIAVDEAHCVEKWGKDFRKDFSRLAEVRSKACRVPVLALTATATTKDRRSIIQSLLLDKCHCICELPNRLNITYSVHKKDAPLLMLNPIIEDLKNNKETANRCIIFCRTYDITFEIFQLLAIELNEIKSLFIDNSSLLSGEEKMKYRLVDKYDACTAPSVKNHIVKSFSDPHGNLRIVVATVAFGMGMDCPNVRCVIHWGPPDDLDMYIQESGRGGRDGLMCEAKLFYSTSEINRKHVSQEMAEYCEEQTKCRRDILMGVFLDKSINCDIKKPYPQHSCCDICSQKCKCNGCKLPPEISQQPLDLDHTPSIQDETSYAKDLELELIEYRSGVFKEQHPTASYLLGYQMSVGLIDDVIKEICTNYLKIESPFCLLDMGVVYPHHADQIFKIIQKYKS